VDTLVEVLAPTSTSLSTTGRRRRRRTRRAVRARSRSVRALRRRSRHERRARGACRALRPRCRRVEGHNVSSAAATPSVSPTPRLRAWPCCCGHARPRLERARRPIVRAPMQSLPGSIGNRGRPRAEPPRGSLCRRGTDIAARKFPSPRAARRDRPDLPTCVCEDRGRRSPERGPAPDSQHHTLGNTRGAWTRRMAVLLPTT
jgi:hypothetical protein